MIESKTYVRMSAEGAYRVGDTRISLDSVVQAYLQGHSAETIADQYPGLLLVEVYGAIAFYLENRDEVHRYLKIQENLWNRSRADAEAKPSPMVERLRAIKRTRGLS